MAFWYEQITRDFQKFDFLAKNVNFLMDLFLKKSLSLLFSDSAQNLVQNGGGDISVRFNLVWFMTLLEIKKMVFFLKKV